MLSRSRIIPSFSWLSGILFVIWSASAWAISFEENRGQFPNEVRFVCHTANTSILVENRALHILDRDSGLRIDFVGAESDANVTGFQRETAQVHYLSAVLGPDSAELHARTFRKVKIHRLYQGIDLLLYLNGTKVEFDFELAAGARPDTIRMQIAGSDSWTLASDGSLSLGGIRVLAPVAYQHKASTRQPIQAWFHRDGEMLSLRTGDYDEQLPLVVDPVVTFTRYAGGDHGESLPRVAVDAAGNSYVGGTTASLPATLNALATLAGGQPVLFVAKYSPSGELLYKSIVASGNSGDNTAGIIYGMKVDAAGQLIVAGALSSGNLPVRAAVQDRPGGNSDGFLMKLNAQGSGVVFCTYWGAGGNDFIFGLATNRAGDIYVTGMTSTALPVTDGYTAPFVRFSDFFVTKFNTSGQLQFSTFIGGELPLQYDKPQNAGFAIRAGNAIAVDDAGNIYITGIVFNESLPVTNAFQPRQSGLSDAFIAKLDSAAKKILYFSYLGGRGGESGRTISVDSRGNAFVAGSTSSDDFPVKDAFQPARGGGDDAFLAKFTPAGVLEFSTYLGGAGTDGVFDSLVDSAGNVLLTGLTTSASFPLRGAIRSTVEGEEVFYTRMSNEGRLLYSTLLGGSKNDSLSSIAQSANGDVFIAMQSTSRDVTGTDPFLPIPLDQNLVLIRLTAAIAVFPAQVNLAGVSASQTVRLDTPPAQDFETTVTVQSGGAWLRVSPFRGTTAASTTITVDTNPAVANALSAGTYRGSVTVSTSEGGLVTIPVTLEIGARVTVAPAALTFTATAGSPALAPQAVSITSDAGPAVLTAVAAADQGGAWLRVSPGQITTPGTLQITADPSTLAAGSYTGSIALRAGTATVATIPVSLQVTSGPVHLSATIAEAGFRWNRDFPLAQEQQFTVSSDGGPAAVTATASESWLQAEIDPRTQSFHTVTLRVLPNGLADGFYQARVTIGAPSATNSVQIPVWLTVAPSGPVITRAGLVNAGSLTADGVAPNQILSLFGSGLQCAATPSIILSGQKATVLAATPGQINFTTPGALPPGRVLVFYRCATSESAQLSFDTVPAAPALFTFPGTGKGNSAAINGDGSFNGAAAGFSPSRPGSVVQLFGTGFGLYGPPDAAGLIRLTQPVRVTVGGVPGRVLFAGQAPGATNGLQQINIQLDDTTPLGDTVPLELEIEGVAIQSGVTLAVR